MSLAGTANRILARYGQPYTLWRETAAAGVNDWTAGALTPTFYPCRARARQFKPDQRAVQGSVSETPRVVIIEGASLSVAPQKGDKLAPGTFTANAPGIAWAQIVNVDAPFDGEGVPVYRCEIRQ